MLNTATIYIQGCLRAVGDISDFGDPNTRQGIRRKIEIENLNFKARYKDSPPLIICKLPYQNVQQEKTRNKFPLKTIMEQNPNSYKGVRFTAEATITGINLIRDWYYISCHQCGITATTKGDNYTCLDHGPQPGPFFSPAADKVDDHPCTELVEKYKPADLKKIPPEILAAQGKTGVFQFHLNTLENLRDLTLDVVFDLKKQDENTDREWMEWMKCIMMKMLQMEQPTPIQG
ncbi:DNA helicase [Tanacetum coccineum]